MRVRLLGHAGVPSAARGGHPRHPHQLQPGDDHDRPRLRRRDLHRADHLGGDRDDHREGEARRDPGHAGRPDRAQRGRPAARAWRAGEVRRRADRRQSRRHPQGRGSSALQAARDRCGRGRRAQPHRPHARGGDRVRRGPRLSAGDPAVASPWAASAPASPTPARISSGWSPTACTRARPARCCWRSRSPAGRSTSSSSCATRPTTPSSSARSRTSTRSACTPATPSPSHPR